MLELYNCRFHIIALELDSWASQPMGICNKRFILRPASEGIALDLSIGLQNCELMFTEAG